MWVVKIGGSLAFSKTLPAWLEVLTCHGGGKVVIVPGGGQFAELVRQAQQYWGFDDVTAHYMALSAMEQFGRMMAGIQPALTPAMTMRRLHEVLNDAQVPVWLPMATTQGEDAIAESWEFTSDSLAAWLAIRMDADRLVLVKSLAPRGAVVSVSELTARAIVDQRFAAVMAMGQFETWWLGEKGDETMAQALRDGMTPGTRVLPSAPEPANARNVGRGQ
ncbi:MAG: hypothetical protein L0Z68_01460 [Gammaproteobacteria bacterium]|nr:hypothetical protein [Gammaproteobacteria bacterium]